MKITLPLLIVSASLALTATATASSGAGLPPHLLAGKYLSTTTAATTTTTASTGGTLDARQTCNLPNFQQEMLNRVNQARAAGRSCGTTYYGPAPALTWNTNLFNAAGAHSTDMAANNYFSHTSLDGRNAGQRITGAGYGWRGYGENIAAGQTSVQSVVDAWLASPGHCANIMNANLVDIGAACVANSTSTYRTYWTMDLARPY